MEKHEIKQILLEQKDEILELFKGKIIPREIEQRAKGLFASDLVKVIMGIRRCGKSVLAHQMLRNHNYGYVNFDDERLLGIKTGELNHIFEELKEIDPGFKHLLLDEAQNVDGWELFVNRLKRKGYNIVITGSNSELLSRELATHLTGRQFGIELYPFSFREYLSYAGLAVRKQDLFRAEMKAEIKRHLEEYVAWGGLPEVFKIEAKGAYLRELFDKIITRDIVSRYNIKYVRDLKEIALCTISNFACRITFHKIRNIFDIKSVHTVKNYLHYLEEAYLLFQVNPFSFKWKEKIKQPRKVYGIDTGLINALLPKTSQDKGKLMENLVFLDLKRAGKEIYYYYQPDYEIDFLTKDGQKIDRLIQVCYSLANEDTKKREIGALVKGAKKLRCKNLCIVTWDDQREIKVGSLTVKIIPLWKWLLT